MLQAGGAADASLRNGMKRAVRKNELPQAPLSRQKSYMTQQQQQQSSFQLHESRLGYRPVQGQLAMGYHPPMTPPLNIEAITTRRRICSAPG